MRLIDADALMEKLNGIWDCNDMTFAPVDVCCIDADCKSCRWRETIEYVKRLVQNQTTISPWHRVEEELPEEEGRYWFAFRFDGHWIFDAAWYTHDISTVIEVTCCERVGGFYKGDIEVYPDYWKPIEPPKEDA